MKGARTLPQINIRIPVDLKDWLTGQATKNCRSLTGEVAALLIEIRKKKECESVDELK